MNDKKDKYGKMLPDSKRLTKIGKLLRRTSIDELPQLFNILSGDMSFIGPRPLLKVYLPYYSIEERRRHDVRPGITGLAQIKGRNKISWDERLLYDIEYIDNQSFLMDFRIAIMTIKNIITSKDIVLVPGDKMKNLDEERRIPSS